MSGATVDAGPTSGGPPSVGLDAGLILPGTAERMRRIQGVTGPQDVPLWMSGGGGTVRAGAAAVASAAGAVRRVRDTIRTLLLDTAASLHWRGTGARSAQARAAAVQGTLALAADRLDDAGAALLGLACALDARHTVLGSASVAWAGAPGHDDRAELLRRIRPAIDALDVVDTHASEALHRVAGELVRLRRGLLDDGWLGDVVGGRPGPEPASDEPDRPWADGVGIDVGRALAGVLDTAASVANAAARHPEAVAQVVAGMLLLDVGASGEAVGFALDATGVGAVAGVPVGVASAVPLVAGAGLLASGSATIMLNAAGPDRVTPSGSRGGEIPRIDVENANFAQKTASRTFSEEGWFSGRTIDDVAKDLRAGRLTPDDVPIDAINRDGHSLILNTRSSLALQEAGIPRSEWHVVNRTGQPDYERRLTDQLTRNKLDATGVSSVRNSGSR